MSKRAIFVKRIEGTHGDMRLFKVEPPMPGGYSDGGPFDYVAVSAAVTLDHGAETYIFPADKDGEVIDWGELDGSFRGALDHAQALQGAGYEIQELAS